MADRGDAAGALGVVFMGILGLMVLGSLAVPGGHSPSRTKARDTPPTDPKAATDWYLRELQGTRYQESASRTREILEQLRQ
jgi:hypothetical protein